MIDLRKFNDARKDHMSDTDREDRKKLNIVDAARLDPSEVDAVTADAGLGDGGTPGSGAAARTLIF